MDQLTQESDEPIAMMSPELDFMRSKLTEVQTKLHQRTEQAQAAEQRKNDLIVHLAHDIKNAADQRDRLSQPAGRGTDPAGSGARPVHPHCAGKGLPAEGLINEFFEITRYHFQTMPLVREKVDLVLHDGADLRRALSR